MLWRRPLPLLVGAYLAGIYLAPHLKVGRLFTLALGGALLPLLLLLGLKFRSRWWLPTGAMLAFCVGHFLAARSLSALDPPSWLLGRRVQVEGWVLSPPRLSERGLSFVLRPLRWRKGKEEGRWLWGRASVFVPAGAVLSGTASTAVAPGRAVVVEGALGPPLGASNFGAFEVERYMAGRGIGATLRAEGLSVGLVARGFAPKVAWLSHLVRRRARALLESSAVGPGGLTARALLGMAFGRAVSPVPPQLEEEFRRAGVAHVLVVSGMHVTALSFFALALCRGYLIGVWRALLPALSAFLYVALAGFSPSAVRAWLMGSALFLAPALKGDFDLLSAVSIAALVSTLAGPFVAYSASFQLSYLAATGIALLYGPIERGLSFLHAALRKPLAVSLAAQLGLWPLFAGLFGRVAPIAPLANLFVVPLFGLLLPVLLASVLLSLVPPLLPVAGGLSLMANFGAWLVLRVVHLMASLPFATVKVAGASRLAVGVAYAFLFSPTLLMTETRGKGPRPERAYLWALWGLVLVLSVGLLRTLKPPRLEVCFLDVGQGEAIFVRSPSGRAMLVDGGNRYVKDGVEVDWGRRAVLPFLASEGVRGLDVVVATHPDDDHVGGLTSVLEEVPVRMLLVSDAFSMEGAHGQLLELARRKRVEVVEAVRGQRLDLGGGAVAQVLWPPVPRLKGTGADENNNSIVLLVRYGRARFLLTADVEGEAERILCSHPDEIKADVLKVAHHGSPGSSTLPFLRAVSPKVAVISVGPANPYGFPSEEVLRRLRAVGARIYRTDFDGAVKVTTDGRRLWIRTARPRRRYGL